MSALLKSGLAGLCLALIASCSSVSIEEYADNRPRLVAEEFFDGRLYAHGIVKNRAGRVIRYFSATIDAYWVDGIGTLDERFTFDDGEQQQRVWKLKPLGDGSYSATAGDVVGEAALQVAGNSLFLDYVLRIPYGGDTIDVRIDDRMYLVSEHVLLNESIMTKWGFEVGQITLVIEKG
ncbi:MAG: DUF3833 domain-containing protein [Gammaproteobacteria bacterium]|nr:MAG: DUF3833 domain-containing protein [Gammaproteobacteria bacterium]UCH39767.1 MAG: DUF3833 domain-containing protein [Gammaproteobacteria bacterium]